MERDYVLTEVSDGEGLLPHGVKCSESYDSEDTVARIYALFPLLRRKFRKLRERGIVVGQAEENKFLVLTVEQLLGEYKRVQKDLEMAISRAERVSQCVLL